MNSEDIAKRLGSISNAKTACMVANSTDEQEIADFRQDLNVKEVKIHVSKPSMAINFGRSKVLDDVLSFEESKLLDKNGKSDVILSAFSNEEIGKFKSIEQSLRRKLKDYSIGNSDFVEYENFVEFLKYYQEKMAEFEEAKDNLRKVYDERVEIFKANVVALAKKLSPSETNDIISRLRTITRQSAQVFVSGFTLELETKFEEYQMSDVELGQLLAKNKDIHERNIRMNILRGLFSEYWNILTNYLGKIYASGNKSTKSYVSTKNKLAESAKSLKRGNCLHLETLNIVADGIFNLSNIMISEVAMDLGVTLLSLIYGEACSIGVELDESVLPNIITTDMLMEQYDCLIGIS